MHGHPSSLSKKSVTRQAFLTGCLLHAPDFLRSCCLIQKAGAMSVCPCFPLVERAQSVRPGRLSRRT